MAQRKSVQKVESFGRVTSNDWSLGWPCRFLVCPKLFCPQCYLPPQFLHRPHNLLLYLPPQFLHRPRNLLLYLQPQIRHRPHNLLLYLQPQFIIPRTLSPHLPLPLLPQLSYLSL